MPWVSSSNSSSAIGFANSSVHRLSEQQTKCMLHTFELVCPDKPASLRYHDIKLCHFLLLLPHLRIIQVAKHKQAFLLILTSYDVEHSMHPQMQHILFKVLSLLKTYLWIESNKMWLFYPFDYKIWMGSTTMYWRYWDNSLLIKYQSAWI